MKSVFDKEGSKGKAKNTVSVSDAVTPLILLAAHTCTQPGKQEVKYRYNSHLHTARHIGNEI